MWPWLGGAWNGAFPTLRRLVDGKGNRWVPVVEHARVAPDSISGGAWGLVCFCGYGCFSAESADALSQVVWIPNFMATNDLTEIS